jgi:FMN reductase
LRSPPLIVGIGGTPRCGSATEKALRIALKSAEAAGARTRAFDGPFLARLPHFYPSDEPPTPDQLDLSQAVSRADGLIIASPGYHGSISGLVKNALDTLELLRTDDRPYFDGRPVGLIVTADGGQAGGSTLATLRAIVHAMRGWPTPLGASLSAGPQLFDDAGGCSDPRDSWQLRTIGEQVTTFASKVPV